MFRKQILQISKSYISNSQCYLQRVTVNCPPFADSISEGDVALKLEVGAIIKEDDIPLEIETDKTAIQAPSPVAGEIVELLVEDGDTVEAGQPLYVIDTDAAGAPVADSASADAAPTSSAIPSVADLKVNLPNVKPVVVVAPLQVGQPAAAAAAAPTPAPKPVAAALKPKTALSFGITREEDRTKLSRVRQRITQRMKDTQNTAATLSTFNEIDMSNIMEMKTKYSDRFEKKHGVKLGLMSAFAKASANALILAPAVNASIDDVTNEMVYRNYVDVSVAVATEHGLVSPVLRNVEKMNYFDIEREISDLAEKAKNGSLSIEDMDCGTFTVNNGGVYKSMFGMNVLNAPQSATLGMHGVADRPVVVNGKVEIRPMMYVGLTYDHRIIDGKDAVTFLRNVKECVEDPRQLLLNL
jgi:2-oxoglutarate dehydrogenase E2 component (dihydrolipoamide succinyltransferase)